MFRAVLQENTDVLRHLAAALLNLPCKEVSSCVILNPIVLGEAFDSKTIIMVLRVLLNGEKLINLEMQMGPLAYWPNRSLLYLCRLLFSLEKGEDYPQLLPSIHIGTLPRSPFPNVREFYSEYLLMNRKSQQSRCKQRTSSL